MYKYAQLKRFHHDRRIQVYMDDFMYVDTEKMPVEDHFTSYNYFGCELQKISTPVTVPKHWPMFSYMRSEDY